MRLEPKYKELLNSALELSGQRATKQREHIYALLLQKRNHPTAEEVYNCLETLAETKLIRQVNFEREPTRYCPNLTKHAHFYCRESGEIVDVDLSDELLDELMKVLPAGFTAKHIEISYDGACNDCHD